jgi:LmbE family N-acetylglucosaminyl deacetylase
MNQSLRHRLKQFYQSRLDSVLREWDDHDLRKSAIVFSPHQDDETLACGGTIIRKKRVGASVKVVYLTDGSGFNQGLIDPHTLSEIREAEAIAATQTLGLSPAAVTFLRFQDGHLNASRATAIEQISDILRQEKPETVFIPYYRELPLVPDHVATNQIVISALEKAGISTTVYEYPIWFWHHYPWTEFSISQRNGFSAIKSILKNSWLSISLGSSLLTDFRDSVDVEAVLDLKRQALYHHQSQMTQFISDPRWQTIAKIANGDFLECFFQKKEIFYGHSVMAPLNR